jgi:hypothetical protein
MIIGLGQCFRRRNITILFRNVLRNGHKNPFLLNFVPQKIFFITNIVEALKLAFINLCPG